MLFIKHFFTFQVAALVFGSMAQPSKIVTGKVYLGLQAKLNPPLQVHVLSIIL
jgi:hypothetical protein